jgi:hypothetical protein
MGKEENIQRALELVDRLRELSEADRRLLKQRIPAAAKGDESALAGVILFPYHHDDREIFSEIFLLMLRK